jgi:hypothetical protein
MINEPDVFVFDYVSTGFTQAAATSKPIIYLDIGLRNLTPPAKKAVVERTLYVSADSSNPADALRLAFEQSSKKCVNRYSDNFSLVRDAGPRDAVIADSVLKSAAVCRGTVRA